MRRWAEPEIRSSGPVVEVVARAPAWPGIVRDLVVLEARARHPPVDQHQMGELLLLIGQLAMHAVVLGQGEQIAAQMLDRERGQQAKRFLEVAQALSRNPAEQVDRDILEAAVE